MAGSDTDRERSARRPSMRALGARASRWFPVRFRPEQHLRIFLARGSRWAHRHGRESGAPEHPRSAPEFGPMRCDIGDRACV